MSSKKDFVPGFLFFCWHIIGMIVTIVIFGAWSVTQFSETGVRTVLTKQKPYEADFYALVQGSITEARSRSNQDLDLLVRYLLNLRKKPDSDAFLNIGFGFALAYSDARVNGGADKPVLGARARLKLAGVSKELQEIFETVAPYLQDPRFAKLITRAEDRERIKAILRGEEVSPVTVDTTLPSFLLALVLLALLSQFLTGFGYFASYGAYHIEYKDNNKKASEIRWWRLPWNRIWPFLALPLWIPGALPVLTFAVFNSRSAIGPWIKERRTLRESQRVTLTPGDDGARLLLRLQDRLRR